MGNTRLDQDTSCTLLTLFQRLQVMLSITKEVYVRAVKRSKAGCIRQISITGADALALQSSFGELTIGNKKIILRA